MELSDLRDAIDRVDAQLLPLFIERMHISEQVALYKKERNMPILNRERERALLARLGERAGADYERAVYHLYQTILELSRARQAELIAEPAAVSARISEALSHEAAIFPQTGLVACQGIEGANQQVACDKLFPRGNIRYYRSFSDVAAAVETCECPFGVLPIENSSNGSVREVYSLLQEHELSVVRSTRLLIRHELLGLPGADISGIKEIFSHPQAIGQCSRFLASLSGVKVTPCANTAVAAQMVAERHDPTVAAISSHPCAAIYGLEPLSDRIQDSENNYTRFFCVTREKIIYDGANRISLIVATENRPGALYELLSKMAALGVNMTKLESCPVSGRDFEYVFFIEMEASVRDAAVCAMLAEMERSCERFHFLGSYAEV